jgi:Domain of unknown function (DUF4145)
MPNESHKTLKVICSLCTRKTNHKILHSITKSGEYEFYSEEYEWQTIQCQGCEGLSFRLIHQDFEQTNDFEDDSKPKITINRYPAFIHNHRQLDSLWAVPPTIKGVYVETISAMASGHHVIASMGLRATLEAVCNHLEVVGRTLDKRIDTLAKNGSISIADRKRLHAIRFLGNDAAHEIRTPNKQDLIVALSIVEHLITSVFILDKKSVTLDTSVDSISELVTLAKHCSIQHDIGSIVTLATLLGKNSRRLGDSFPKLELEFESKVAAGELIYFQIEQPSTKESSPKFRIVSQLDVFDDL